MSWWQLVALNQERRGIKRVQRATPPVACPNDGQVLFREPAQAGGRLGCNFCGWRWNGVSNPLVTDDLTDEKPPRRMEW